MGKTVSEQPRLVFKQFKGFQAMDEHGKVKTILFLNASKEVVGIIGKNFLSFVSLKTAVSFVCSAFENKMCKNSVSRKSKSSHGIFYD